MYVGGTGYGFRVYRFTLNPRWLAFHALVVVVVFGCIQLGGWQFDRSQQRRASNAVVEDNIGRAPVPVEEIVATIGRGAGAAPAPDSPAGDPSAVDDRAQWRSVTATGRYDDSAAVLLRNRTLDGPKGFEVLVPLVTDSGPVLLVNRGWIPAGRSASEIVDVPAAPSGEVTVTGRLRPSQPSTAGQRAAATSAPQRSVVRIDVPWLTEGLPYPTYAGYAELTGESPPPGKAPQLLPPPDLGSGPHLAYAAQWYVFAVVGVVGWVLLLRREAHDRRQQFSSTAPRAIVTAGV